MFKGILEKVTETNFLPLGKFYLFLVHVMYAPCSKPSAMAAGNAIQTTPVQIMLVVRLCCSTQIMHRAVARSSQLVRPGLTLSTM